MKMSLEGAKLICLNADDNGQFETISANGRTFKFGYYMDCDVVLEHPDAMGLQCIINCDAFGRVTIENRCSDQPITLDGKTLVKLRPLLHNTEICILDKKYLWQFDGNPQPKGFQMEDINDFTTPSKQMKNAQQPPNSEPARKWRRPLQTRLTIHSFAYCIKAGESPKDVETTTDENKPLNIHERIIDADTVPNKRLSSSPPPIENISDFIDLNTPKVGQSSFNRRDQPLSCCKLSETVITSYSPRETGIRQEKSFAVVQSPLTTSNVKIANDVSLGPFHHIVSPQTIQNYRPSMHLIDLITPKKLVPPTSSPSRTLLKSTLKKYLQTPKKKSPETPKKLKKNIDLSTPGSSDTVYSVRSTDDESVIILSDDCSGSSPVAKTPPRARTPQSLMKRVILNSAKKVAVNKKLLNMSESKSTLTPITSKNPAAVRFQSQSTPQRKSLGRFPSSAESMSAGKPRRNLVTSTPFRQRTEVVSSSSSRRSLLINSQSSPKKESRNSLMLKQALSLTPLTTITTQNRKSVSCLKSQNKPRKSVSFLENVEKEEQTNVDKVEKAEDEKVEVDQLNNTFTIEDNINNDIELDKAASSHGKNETLSPEKEKCQEEVREEVREPSKCLSQSKMSMSSEKLDSQTLSTTPECTVITSSLEKPTGSVLLHSEAKHQASVDTKPELIHSLSIVSQVEIISDNQKQLDTEFQDELLENQNSDLQSTNLSKINESVIGKHSESIREHTDYDFDCVDDIFKTPKAKNVMILSSPKSISLQKPASDSVELCHSTEFDLSANLDELFQTPQSEFITRRIATTTPATAAPIESLSPEEAFDMLVGRPILKKSYARKTPPKKQELSPLKTSNDPTLPKTDIEEWIDSVNELLDDPQDEDEMSYLTATMEDISRDPLMSQSVTASSNANRRVKLLNTPRDEYEMTINEENEEESENKINQTTQKDPLEATVPVPRSLSPNISGIGLLDHTSESIFSETLALSDESSLKETEKTMKLSDNHENTALAINQKQLNVSQEDKARREIEEAFKNFENQRKALEEKRLASTPEAKKSSLSKIANRRTMGSLVPLDPTFDLKAIKVKQTEQNLNAKGFGKSITKTIKFENAKEEPRISDLKSHLHLQNSEREVSLGKSLLLEERNQESKKTEEFSQQQLAPDKIEASSSCQIEREIELAFENFEEEPEFSEQRVAKTPEPMKVILKDHRRTLGTELISEVKLDLQAAKNEREMELAFEHFKEEPEVSEQRVAKTPEPTKVTLKDHRRTLGCALIPEVKLDLQAAKNERDMELAFEHFEEEPEFSEQRAAKTPEPRKVTLKDHRRTLGSALIPEVKLDLQAAKKEREMELAFENFEEEPEFSEQRVAKTPEPIKVALKDHRRTLGCALIPEVKLDLQAAKAERDMELAFENFEEEPEFSEQRVAKTPEPTKVTLKDHRRTPGSALIPEVKLDLQAAKNEREMELAFEHFEEEPEFSEQRAAKTPEPTKATLKDHRRTLGSALIPEVKLDLQAAKKEREMELAFENFEEEPEFSEQRVAKTPEPTKATLKDHRRTLGSALIPEVKLDLQAAKNEREMELAFEHFEEEPEFSEQRVAKTPEPTKATLKDHRRTLGSALIPEVKLDLQAAKNEREMELAFEHFEEEPEFSEQRAAKTPEPTKATLKDHRRTLGSALIPEVKLDLQAAKKEREMELAFENFEEEPEFSEQRVAKTPEPTKATLKDQRRTLGSALIPEVKLDLQAAKNEREMELAFEHFEEEPEFSEQRVAKTPEPTKATLKDHRRTLGSALIPEVKIDLQAAKNEREMELAFEHFEEEPEFSEQRVAKTPEPIKVALKDHRRTLGSALIPEVKLDLQAAKNEREMELAFEHFEEEPEFSEQRVAKTPEPTKATLKDHRRTLGSALIPEVKLDLQAAKKEREMELAFENFEEEPEFSEQRVAKTPEPTKATLKDHRRTLGSALIPEVKLDLQAAKKEREMELAFENFEEDPEFSEQRVAKTPEPMKVSLKDHRRTLGSALIPEVKLDLQAAKNEREMELAFEHFEEEPEFSEQRVAKTPEPIKVALKDHRRTLGSALIPEVKLDLQAAKNEREMELAFEHFEDVPAFSEQRVVKTPEPTKVTLKDHRRTLGSALIPDVTFDLESARAERELELAFENFEEEPEFSEQRVAKTPEPMKVALKDHRRTLGSALIPEVKLDLQAAKAERELELAFENFEEEPEFSEQRVAKTPEPMKVALKDHRRTVGSALNPEVKLDLQAARAERELELSFENFEEEPEFSEQRVVKTPEPTKVTLKDHRRTLGSALIPEVKLDLQAAKAELELEQAFKNFEDEPTFSEQRVAKTPEPIKKSQKDHRRTLGSSLITEVKLDLQAVKAERDLKLDNTNIKNMTLDTETGEYAKLECTELERNLDQDEENIHLIEESASNLLVKSISEVTAIEKINESNTHKNEISKEQIELKNVKKDNEDQKADNDVTIANIQSYEEVKSENLFKSEPQIDESTTVRSLKIRPDPKEEDDQSKLNAFATVKNEGVENINAPAPRRTRKKTVDSLDDCKPSAGEDASMAQSKPQMRRTRQNSIDSFTDDKKTTRPSRKELKTSSSEDVPIKTTTLRIDSTDVDSTEDESNPTSKNPSKKRIRKVVSKTTETPLKETQLHHILEPIDEEGIKSEESKITNQEIEAKSFIDLRDDADEITSLSPIAARSRIRGRKAQLNVVLIESNDSNHYVSDKESTNEVDSVNKYIDTQEDGNSKEECCEKIDITNDADESIPSTPLPLHSRGRRPSKTKVPSNLLVPGLRRTRKGSIQQDIEVQTVDHVEIVLKKNIEPLESNVLKDDSKPDEYDVQATEADEDIVPSTPVETKTRRRQVSNKQKTSPKNPTKTSTNLELVDLESNVENNGTSASLPSRTRGRKAISKHEIVSVNVTTEEIIPDKQIISTIKDSGEKETLQSTSVSLKSQDQKTESESVTFEGSQTKSPTVCDEKIISVPTQVEKPVPASPVLSKTRGRRAAVKANLESESVTPKGRVGRPKGVKKTDLGAESQEDDRIEKVVETSSSDSTKNSTPSELKTETPAAIQKNSTPKIKSPIKVEEPVPTSSLLSKTRGRKAAVKANLDTENATPKGRIGRPKGASKTDLGTESTDVAAAREKDSQGDDRIEKVVETSSSDSTKISTSSELKIETPAAIQNITPQIKSSIQVEKPLPTSPILSKTRGRRAAVKANLESESSTPKGRIGRPKGTKKTNFRDESSETAAAGENDSQKVVETSSSDITKISTSPELKNETPAGIQNSLPEIRPIERSNANKKTLLGSEGTDETPSGEDNFKNDEKISKVVDDPSLEVPAAIEANITSKTRGRRAAALKPQIPENEVAAVRRGRKRAGEQMSETQPSQETESQEEEIKLNIPDCQLDSKSQDEKVVHAVDSEQLITSVPLKKRGRKAAVKVEPAVPRPVVGTPETVLTTDETQIKEDNTNDEESTAKVVDVPSPDVFKSREIKNENEGLVDVDENNLTTKTTRGRRAAVKPEYVVPPGKSGRKRANNEQTTESQSLQENKNEVTKVKGCQIDATNQDEHDKSVAVVEQPMTPVPKKRGRKAAVKTEPEIYTLAIEAPVQRAGRRKPADLHEEKLSSPAEVYTVEVDETEEHVPINLPSSKICKTIDSIPTRSITESSTPVRRGGRRNVAGKPVDLQNSPPESEKITTEIHEKQDESANLSKTKQNKVLLTLESSTPIRRGGRARGLRTNVENSATNSNVELPKSRGRKANLKVEVIDSSKEIEHVIELVSDEDKSASHTNPNPIKSEPLSVENSPIVQQTRQKRSALQRETTEKEDKFTKHTDKTAVKQETTEALNESSTTDGDIHEQLSAKKRTRRAPVKLTEFIVSNLVQRIKPENLDSKSESSDTEIQNPTVPKKRGRPPTAKLQNVESTQDSTPARKRGRKAIVVKDDDHIESAAPRKGGRQGKSKDEAAVTLIEDLHKDDNKKDESCVLVSDEGKPEESCQKKQTRRGKAVLEATSPVSEEQQIQIEVITENKPTRGRGKALLKNNSTLESTAHTEDEQSASTKPKSNRGRKAATKADPENEITQEKTSEPEFSSNTKIETSQHEDKEKVVTKPRRGRKAATAEPADNSPVTSKPSPVTKKTTRGRKGAVKNVTFESDDAQTRSGKQQDNDTQPTSKRRNLEILINDDQQDTPSKRARRKPNKLLSDEFVT